jgi:hypothetical protein
MKQRGQKKKKDNLGATLMKASRNRTGNTAALTEKERHAINNTVEVPTHLQNTKVISRLLVLSIVSS